MKSECRIVLTPRCLRVYEAYTEQVIVGIRSESGSQAKKWVSSESGSSKKVCLRSKWVTGQKVGLRSKCGSQVRKFVSGQSGSQVKKCVSSQKVGHRSKSGSRVTDGSLQVKK